MQSAGHSFAYLDSASPSVMTDHSVKFKTVLVASAGA